MSHGTPKLTWLVTGASSGFGLAICRVAQAHKQKVIATSRNPSRTPDLVSEIESNGGQWHALDLNEPDCDSVITQLEASGTSIDVLVNGAGFSLLGPGECFTEEEARRQMETSFFGPYRLIRAVLPYMRQRRSGMIVNLGSGAGVFGRESMALYGASKSAMDALIRIIAKELVPFNIRTLNVILGAFNTNFVNAKSVAETPLPEDYVGSVVEKTMDSPAHLEGDPVKAANVIYEMVVGEGVGSGKENERLIPLGRDMWRAMGIIRDDHLHAMDTFENVCNNVYLDEAA